MASMRLLPHSRMRLVGLTGGIGAGKSLVATCWRCLGIPVIDADAVARRQAEPGGPAWEAIRDLLGPEVLAPGGRIDRRAVAARVFRDPKLRRALEQHTHPLVIREVSLRLHRLEESRCPMAVIEAALLIETDLDRQVDRTVVVVAPEEQRIARVRRRDGLPEEEIRARIAAQLPDEARLLRAHESIRNDGTLQALLGRARYVALDLLLEARGKDEERAMPLR